MKKSVLIALVAGVAVVAALLAFALAALFGGEDGGASSSRVSSSSAPSSAPASSSASPGPASASQSVKEAGGLPPPAIAMAAPEGPYAPVGPSNIGSLRGSWLYLYEDPRGNMAYQYKFDEAEGHMTISDGLMFTGAGSYYAGPYSVEGDIITARVRESGFDLPEDLPEITLTLRAELPGDSEAVAFTLLSFENQTPAFEGVFAPLLNQQMFYLPSETVSEWLMARSQ